MVENKPDGSIVRLHFKPPESSTCPVNAKFIDCLQNFSWKIKRTLSGGRPYCKQMNTNTRMLAEQTKTLETFYKTGSTSVSLSAICCLSSETQLCDHWQTLVPNRAIFPPCHQMVPLRIDAWPLFVFYLEPGS